MKKKQQYKFWTLLLIPEGTRQPTQWTLSRFFVQSLMLGSLIVALLLGYFVLDYIALTQMRTRFHEIVKENENLKSEANVLFSDLNEVKKSLFQVEDYMGKLEEITQVRLKTVKKKTGIGPLTAEEFKIATKQNEVEKNSFEQALPGAIKEEGLFFQPVFERLYGLAKFADKQTIEIQKVLSNLGKQRSLLNAIPTVSPTNGWVTSGFGYRVSPFTGERTLHRGLDIGAPPSTPIYSPADGVVIYSGFKDDFGNFIMVAHGYGIVSRFGHNSQNTVQVGQRVGRGEQIGTIGMSGRATGPHLHYEIYVNGQPTDPKKFILNLSDEEYLIR